MNRIHFIIITQDYISWTQQQKAISFYKYASIAPLNLALHGKYKKLNESWNVQDLAGLVVAQYGA